MSFPDVDTFGMQFVHPHWEDVHAIINITSSSKGFTPTIKNTLYSKAFMIFQAQQNCHFILALTICQSKAYFNVFNQAGMVHSVALEIVAECTKLLHILARWAFADETHIGYDPSITQNGGLTTISCGGHEYTIITTMFANSTIHGRGTICYHAQAEGKNYVIKDSCPTPTGPWPSPNFWRRQRRQPPETHWCACSLKAGFTTLYYPIDTFSVEKELISVLIDTVTSMWWCSIHIPQLTPHDQLTKILSRKCSYFTEISVLITMSRVVTPSPTPLALYVSFYAKGC